MYGNNVFCLQQLAGDKCIIGVHSEVAADRKHCVFKSIELGQQLHIAEECGVTCEVQLSAVEIDDDAAGVTAGNAAAVEGQCQAYLAEGKLKGAAKMHSVCFAAGILRQTADFGSGDDGSVTIFGDFKGTAQMVEVTVADENIINLNVFGGESFRIIVQIRVEDNSGIIFSKIKQAWLMKWNFADIIFPP